MVGPGEEARVRSGQERAQREAVGGTEPVGDLGIMQNVAEGQRAAELMEVDPELKAEDGEESRGRERSQRQERFPPLQLRLEAVKCDVGERRGKQDIVDPEQTGETVQQPQQEDGPLPGRHVQRERDAAEDRADSRRVAHGVEAGVDERAVEVPPLAGDRADHEIGLEKVRIPVLNMEMDERPDRPAGDRERGAQIRKAETAQDRKTKHQRSRRENEGREVRERNRNVVEAFRTGRQQERQVEQPGSDRESPRTGETPVKHVECGFEVSGLIGRGRNDIVPFCQQIQQEQQPDEHDCGDEKASFRL